jgi:hypothetical protein
VPWYYTGQCISSFLSAVFNPVRCPGFVIKLFFLKIKRPQNPNRKNFQQMSKTKLFLSVGQFGISTSRARQEVHPKTCRCASFQIIGTQTLPCLHGPTQTGTCALFSTGFAFFFLKYQTDRLVHSSVDFFRAANLDRNIDLQVRELSYLYNHIQWDSWFQDNKETEVYGLDWFKLQITAGLN